MNHNVEYGMSKFKNIGGITCYMNSILHILQQAPIFVIYITQIKFRDNLILKIKKSEDLETYIIFELLRLFKSSHENDDVIITPLKFKHLIGIKNEMWAEYRHQDSQEFFNFLISQIQEEIGFKSHFVSYLNFDNNKNNNVFDNLNTIISYNSYIKNITHEYSELKNMFDGLSQTTKVCLYCGTNNVNYESFLSLQVSIPDNKNNIYECFDHLIEKEQLDEDNKWKCNFCGIKNRAFTNTILWKTPKILVIHIKRFINNMYGQPYKKNTTNIEYPIIDLDLTKYFEKNSPFANQAKYDLFGVNLHESMGSRENINGGHYTSIVKNMINNEWYLYNDSNDLQKLNYNDLQSRDAYLLFYYQH